MGREVELYGAAPDELKVLYERGCTHYLELYNESGRPPRMQEVAARVDESHPGEYPSTDFILARLDGPEFQEELRIRRKENLIGHVGPRLLMAEMAASIARDALEETLDRLRDPQQRREISNRDLNSLLKTAADLALAADKDLDEVAQAAPINKGTIFNLFTQLPPERASVVMQEMARQIAAKERND